MKWYDPRTWFSPSAAMPGSAAGGSFPILRKPDADDEQARAGPPGIQLPAFLPYWNDVLGEGPPPRVLRKMLAEPHVKAALLGKVLAVCALSLKVRPADRKKAKDRLVADFVRWNLTERLAGGVSGLVWTVLSGGCIDGVSIAEKVWAVQETGRFAGKHVLTHVKAKDVGNDVVAVTDDFRNITSLLGLRYNAGVSFDPGDFLIYRHLPLYESPVGMSDFRAAYRDYWVLDTARKLRAVALNRNATPLLFGTYKTASQKASLENALGLAKSQNWISAPEGVQIRAIEIAGRADDIFENAEKALIHSIFLSIQGAYLQALEGSVSNAAGNSQVHASTADLWVWFLSASFNSLLNDRNSGLIVDMVDRNFVVDEYPPVSLEAVDAGQLAQDWKIDQGLHAAGLDLSREELYERYGRTPPRDEEDRLAGAV